MEVLMAIAQSFLTQNAPTWALLLVALLAFVYVVYAKKSTNNLATAKQADAKYQRFVDDMQEQLERERVYGKEAAARIDSLYNDVAFLRGQNEVLTSHMKMFVSCPKPDCPFRDVRQTLS